MQTARLREFTRGDLPSAQSWEDEVILVVETSGARAVLYSDGVVWNTVGNTSTVQTFQVRELIETVANKAYTFILKTAFGCTVTNVTTKCLSGTATLTGAIDGVNLGGTANAVSSTEVSQAQTTANVMAAGTDLVFTASANAACLDMAVNVTLTRTLS